MLAVSQICSVAIDRNTPYASHETMSSPLELSSRYLFVVHAAGPTYSQASTGHRLRILEALVASSGFFLALLSSRTSPRIRNAYTLGHRVKTKNKCKCIDAVTISTRNEPRQFILLAAGQPGRGSLSRASYSRLYILWEEEKNQFRRPDMSVSQVRITAQPGPAGPHPTAPASNIWNLHFCPVHFQPHPSALSSRPICRAAVRLPT